MKISLSFKEHELSMYLHCKNQLSASIYIKQLILDDMKRKQEEKEIKRDDR